MLGHCSQTAGGIDRQLALTPGECCFRHGTPPLLWDYANRGILSRIEQRLEASSLVIDRVEKQGGPPVGPPFFSTQPRYRIALATICDSLFPFRGVWACVPGGAMAAYRIYCMDGAGRISSADWIDAKNDEDAVGQTRKLKEKAVRCEIWQKDRLVARLPAHFSSTA